MGHLLTSHVNAVWSVNLIVVFKFYTESHCDYTSVSWVVVHSARLTNYWSFNEYSVVLMTQLKIRSLMFFFFNWSLFLNTILLLAT